MVNVGNDGDIAKRLHDESRSGWRGASKARGVYTSAAPLVHAIKGHKYSPLGASPTARRATAGRTLHIFSAFFKLYALI